MSPKFVSEIRSVWMPLKGASTLERLSPKNRLGGDIYVDVATQLNFWRQILGVYAASKSICILFVFVFPVVLNTYT